MVLRSPTDPSLRPPAPSASSVVNSAPPFQSVESDCAAVLRALVEAGGAMTADALCAQTTRRAAARVHDLKKFHAVGITCSLEPAPGSAAGKKDYVYRLDNLAHARSLLKQWGVEFTAEGR